MLQTMHTQKDLEALQVKYEKQQVASDALECSTVSQEISDIPVNQYNQISWLKSWERLVFFLRQGRIS